MFGSQSEGAIYSGGEGVVVSGGSMVTGMNLGTLTLTHILEKQEVVSS